MTNKETLHGQNTTPPAEKVFIRHWIVKVQVNDGNEEINNNYYDPSYGVTYINEADFESKAVEGYLQEFVIDAELNTEVRRFRFTKDEDEVGIVFNPPSNK